MNPIQQWLDGPQDYEAGRRLYEQHGQLSQLKRTLSQGPKPYNVAALRRELAKLARAGVVQAVAQAVPVVESVLAARPALAITGRAPGVDDYGNRVAPESYFLPLATAELLTDLEKQWKPLYKEASHLQGQLEHAPDNQARAELSHRILDLMEQVEGHWETGAYVKEHGQLPPAPAAPAPAPALDLTDRAAVLKRRNNLRAQISKQRHNAERAAEVAAWEAEKAHLDTHLKTLPNEKPV